MPNKIKISLHKTVLLVALSVFKSVLVVSFPLMIMFFINNFYDPVTSKKVILVMFGVIVIQTIYGVVSSFIEQKILNQKIYEMKKIVLRNSINSLYDVDISSYTTQIPFLFDNFYKAKIRIISNIIEVFILIMLILSINVNIFILLLIVGMIILIFPVIVSKYQKKLTNDFIKANKDEITVIKEGIHNKNTISAFKANSFYERVNGVLDRSMKHENILFNFNSIINELVVLVIFITTLILFFIGVHSIGLGEIIGLINIIVILLMCISQIFTDMNKIRSCEDIIQRLVIDLDVVEKHDDEVKFLQSSDIFMERGKNYLLIGANGSGKSFFLKKILNGEDTLFNNKFCNSSRVLYIDNNAEIFNSDYESNVSLNFSSILTDTIYNLSEGEKQLLVVKRVLKHIEDFDVIIFDEALSQIEEETRYKIVNYFRKMDKIFIYVSHDSKVLSCDYDKVIDFGGEKYARS